MFKFYKNKYTKLKKNINLYIYLSLFILKIIIKKNSCSLIINYYN